MLKFGDISVWNFLDPIEFIQALYDSAKELNVKCSYQRFSDRLGFGETSYSHQVLAGKRPISGKTSHTIAAALELIEIDKNYFAALCRYRFSKEQIERDEAMSEIIAMRQSLIPSDLDRAHTEYFSEWYHPVIRELVSLRGFVADPKWIAARLLPKISEEQAKHSLELLQRIGFVSFDASTNQWKNLDKNILTKDMVRSLVLKRYHQAMIDLARSAVTSLPAHKREVTATTLALRTEDIPKIAEMFRKLNLEIIEKYSTDTRDASTEIFQMNTQLFTVTGDQE